MCMYEIIEVGRAGSEGTNKGNRAHIHIPKVSV